MNPRFNRALEILVGRKRAYSQAPRYLFYPELAPIQFFNREDFPFLDQVEAAWLDIRGELEALDNSASEFEPYLKTNTNRPPKKSFGLADNLDWGAYFLIKNGAVTSGAKQCPKTMAALSDAPLARIPGRAPGALFSRLLPGAHIPPHTGMINARLICHLAVIAPRNCYFRVGNETREWEEGKTWVFDDTIDHEAKNASDRVRTVLLFDIWRPDLDESERAGIVALCEAVDQFAGSRDWD
jgi:aspartyl/asparaginyl beta-hydroxylase (cupin superfamily)